MSTPHYEARREMVEITNDGLLGGKPDHMRKFAPVPWRYYCDNVEITLEEYTAGIAAHRRDMPRFNAVEMQAIRKALQAAETVIAHADDPARQQTKIEYLSWALADLPDAVQAWVLEDEQ